MPSFRTGHVTKLISERPGLQRVEVDGEPTYVLTQVQGDVSLGDEVVINTTAVDLDLGTGGWHVLHWNLSRQGYALAGKGHIMKMRYTSVQLDVGAVEELGELQDPVALHGKPIVVLPLHSLLAPVVATLKHLRPATTVAYVMTDVASLPIAISDVVYGLKEAGLVDMTLTAGQAFGGDIECVNAASAIHVAAQMADVVVVGMGPGNVGTGSSLGFAGLEVASLGDLAVALGGTAIACLRWSDQDPRERHRGLSHHSVMALKIAARPFEIAIPISDRVGEVQKALSEQGLDRSHRVTPVETPDVIDLLSKAGLKITSMGRPLSEDPMFAQMGAASAALASTVLQSD